MGGLDLLALIAPQIDHAQAVLLALQQFVELCCGVAPARVGLGDGIGGDAAKAVEQMRCCAWSKLVRVSVCAWTRASSGASCLSTATVAG